LGGTNTQIKLVRCGGGGKVGKNHAGAKKKKKNLVEIQGAVSKQGGRNKELKKRAFVWGT